MSNLGKMPNDNHSSVEGGNDHMTLESAKKLVRLIAEVKGMDPLIYSRELLKKSREQTKNQQNRNNPSQNS